MDQRKTNNTLWYSLGLAALLCIAFLGSIAAPALARYRTDKKVPVTFQVRPPAQVYLGMMQIPASAEEASTEETTTQTTAASEEEPDEVFVPNVQPEWTEVQEGVLQLRLVVANGTSDTEFSEKGQHVKFRLFGSLGLWSEGETARITLRAAQGSEVVELEGRVTFVDEGSVLFSTHGNGWTYSFYIPETEEEYTWMLPGGSFNYVDLLLTMDSSNVSNSSLLQPQIISELITQ